MGGPIGAEPLGRVCRLGPRQPIPAQQRAFGGRLPPTTTRGPRHHCSPLPYGPSSLQAAAAPLVAGSSQGPSGAVTLESSSKTVSFSLAPANALVLHWPDRTPIFCASRSFVVIVVVSLPVAAAIVDADIAAASYSTYHQLTHLSGKQ